LPFPPPPSCSGTCRSSSPPPPATVLRLVRGGRELPGLRRPRVTASLASPTASRLPRQPKPWERPAAALDPGSAQPKLTRLFPAETAPGTQGTPPSQRWSHPTAHA
uniref:Peroxisomal membrane protein PEX14-like KPWE domain-containing protein n=1 Tax=Pelusios castaneus TaxID=367368 RepID=A0A8C8STN6_9SAUR